MAEIERLKAEIKDFERDLREDQSSGWILGDAQEALDFMRRKLESSDHSPLTPRRYQNE